MTHLQDWLARYPETTSATYAQVLGEFAHTVEPDSATQEHVIAYWKSLNGQASGTVAKKLAALRSFYTYLIIRGVRNDNPALIVRVPKVDHLRTVDYLTAEQVTQLIGSFTDSPKDIRDRAIVSVLLHGLRIAEAVGLNAEDYREGDLRVVGKGNKMRLVPLSPTAQDFLDIYLGPRRTGPMFLSVYQQGDRIARRALRDAVYAATERIGARTHPHALRHTCGTIMMRRTGNLAAVQEVLGHANPATTRIYAHLDTSDLRRAVEQSDLLGEAPTLRVLEGVA